jgi:hypothetical protein
MNILIIKYLIYDAMEIPYNQRVALSKAGVVEVVRVVKVGVVIKVADDY